MCREAWGFKSPLPHYVRLLGDLLLVTDCPARDRGSRRLLRSLGIATRVPRPGGWLLTRQLKSGAKGRPDPGDSLPAYPPNRLRFTSAAARH